MQTNYTVREGEGVVKVCVNLTKPEEDIGKEEVVVDVHDDTYFLPDVALAGE